MASRIETKFTALKTLLKYLIHLVIAPSSKFAAAVPDGVTGNTSLARFERVIARRANPQTRLLRTRVMQKDTLYYDGNCPLCRAEIAKLRRFSKNRIELRDVHHLETGETDIEKSDLLARLHLKTADGEWITGLKANILAWQHTPFRRLWQVLDWPLVNRISYPCYELWLRSRSANTCDTQTCATGDVERKSGSH